MKNRNYKTIRSNSELEKHVGTDQFPKVYRHPVLPLARLPVGHVGPGTNVRRNPGKARVRGKALVPRFGWLVLGCIEADFLQINILILQDFSSSTKFAHFCTAPNSKAFVNFDIVFVIL